MYRVFLLADPRNGLSNTLREEADREGMTCQSGVDLSFLEDPDSSISPEVVLLDPGSFLPAQCRQYIDKCQKLKLPILALVPHDLVSEYDPALSPDDFILAPLQPGELLARIKQALYRVGGPPSQQVLKVGDLMIDLERYDVLMSGRRVSLTYKEFQLLVLLCSNPGRVYTRDALLSQVWGYDYLGGTRTVDVHIRRLRSKIEDPDHSFVETIWNVGYRFKSPA